MFASASAAAQPSVANPRPLPVGLSPPLERSPKPARLSEALVTEAVPPAEWTYPVVLHFNGPGETKTVLRPRAKKTRAAAPRRVLGCDSVPFCEGSVCGRFLRPRASVH